MDKKVFIITSEEENAKVYKMRVHPYVVYGVVLAFCILLGVMIGYAIFESEIWNASFQQTVRWQEDMKAVQAEKDQKIEELTGQISELTVRIADLEDQNQVLTDNLSEKIESEAVLAAKVEAAYLPTDFPLTGAATMKEVDGEEPMCVFTSSLDGEMVIATAHGTVIAVNADAEYEQNVWIDHENGYVTIYRSKGDIKVQKGQKVTKGTTLFIQGKDQSEMGYQMIKDGVYINPTEMMSVNG